MFLISLWRISFVSTDYCFPHAFNNTMDMPHQRLTFTSVKKFAKSKGFIVEIEIDGTYSLFHEKNSEEIESCRNLQEVWDSLSNNYTSGAN